VHGIGMSARAANRGLLAGIATAIGQSIFIGNSDGGSTIVMWGGAARREKPAPIGVPVAEVIAIVNGSDRFGSANDDRPVGDAL